MRFAYRLLLLLVVIAVLLPGCEMKSPSVTGNGDGGPGGDAAPVPDHDAAVPGDDGGPVGPVRYVDLIFSSEELVVARDIIYTVVEDRYGTHRLLLDLFRPGDSDPVAERPLIVWVHGGSFRTGDRRQLAAYAREFARRGYVTVSIDYRLLRALDPDKGPQEAAEMAQEDVEAAIEFLSEHAAEHGIDPARIIVGGFSAGSITSFQVGYRYEHTGHADPIVIGVAALEGLLIRPGDLAAGDPPFILIRSESVGGNEDCDDSSCEAIFTALLEAAEALGIAADMVILPDTVHADLISAELVPAISAIVAPFLHQQALDGAAE